MLGALMYCSKIIMDALPNIHLLGMFTMTYTLVFRKKALIPIYIFVMITGLFGGFAAWWLPYLYIWAVLWGVTMLLPKTEDTVVTVHKIDETPEGKLVVTVLDGTRMRKLNASKQSIITTMGPA